MAIAPMSQILHGAQKRKGIVSYFETWDYGSFKISLGAAEELGCPVINGEKQYCPLYL